MSTLSRREVLQQGLAGGVLLATGYAGVIEPTWIETVSVTVPVPGLPRQWDGLKISLFADVHYPRNIGHEKIQRACRLAMEFQPDIIAVPGDFVDGHSRIPRVPSFKGLFDQLSAPLGVFGTLGNHDHALDPVGVRRQLADSTPIRLLDNAHVTFERGGVPLCLAGIGDLQLGIVDETKALQGVPPDTPVLLLSHNPDYAEDRTAKRSVALQLSGHTHGGEVVLPFFDGVVVATKYPHKFQRGLARGRSHPVYVTRGIGRPRCASLFSVPEVTWLTLIST